jgi:hypothetical protein
MQPKHLLIKSHGKGWYKVQRVSEFKNKALAAPILVPMNPHSGNENFFKFFGLDQ